MTKENEEKAKKVVENIFNDLPRDNILIESIVTASNEAVNESLILEARTKCVSFEAWRAETGKSVYNVVKSVIPGTKTAQKDFSKRLNKNEFLKEFVSSIVKDFLKTDEECKNFYKDLNN